MFYNSSYNQSTFKNTGGGPVLASSYDVKMSYFNDDSFYVSDENNKVIILYDANATFVKKIAFDTAYFISPAPNGYVYLSARYRGANIYRCDKNLNTVETFTINTGHQHSSHIRYSNHTGLVYTCDYITGYVNIFDLSFNRLAESFNFNAQYSQIPHSIATYQSAVYGALIYVCSQNNNLHVIKNSDKNSS